MISERELAEVHSSIWAEVAPNLPRIIRGLNLSGREIFAPPMEKRVLPERIYLVNEVGFKIFEAAEKGVTVSFEAAVEAVLANHKSTETERFFSWAKGKLLASERQDAVELANRTREAIPRYVRGRFGLEADAEADDWKLETPSFKGVGILSPCSGDGQFGNTLVEIKSGGRDLRSIDLRQVIVYYVLGVLERREPPIDYCLLVNPRQGYRIHFHFQDFMSAISGLPTSEFTAIIRDYLVNWKACE